MIVEFDKSFLKSLDKIKDSDLNLKIEKIKNIHDDYLKSDDWWGMPYRKVIKNQLKGVCPI